MKCSFWLLVVLLSVNLVFGATQVYIPDPYATNSTQVFNVYQEYYSGSMPNQSYQCSGGSNEYIYNVTWNDGLASYLCSADDVGVGGSGANNYTSAITWTDSTDTLTLSRVGMIDLTLRIAGLGTGSSNLTLLDIALGLGNWSLDKSSYATISRVDGNISTVNTNILNNYTALNDKISNLNASESGKATISSLTNNISSVNTNIANNVSLLATITSLSSNVTSLGSAIDSNLTKANTNLQNNNTELSNRITAVNGTANTKALPGTASCSAGSVAQNVTTSVSGTTSQCVSPLFSYTESDTTANLNIRNNNTELTNRITAVNATANTKAFPGTCSGTAVTQNTTNTGVQCLTVLTTESDTTANTNIRNNNTELSNRITAVNGTANTKVAPLSVNCSTTDQVTGFDLTSSGATLRCSAQGSGGGMTGWIFSNGSVTETVTDGERINITAGTGAAVSQTAGQITISTLETDATANTNIQNNYTSLITRIDTNTTQVNTNIQNNVTLLAGIIRVDGNISTVNLNIRNNVSLLTTIVRVDGNISTVNTNIVNNVTGLITRADGNFSTVNSNIMNNNTELSNRIIAVNGTANTKALPGTCTGNNVVQNTTASGVQCYAPTVSESDPKALIDNTTQAGLISARAFPGTCSAGSVVQNTTASGVQCVVDQTSAGLSINYSQTVFNVKNYGAVGNGLTDDTNAFRAAVTAAINNSGGIVYMPIGVYNLTSPIYFNSTIANTQIILMGEGYKSQIKTSFGTSSSGQNYTFYVNIHPDGTKAASYPTSPRVIFENFYATGTDTANVSLIKIQETGITMRNVKLQYYYTGVGFVDSYSDRNFFYGVQSQYTRAGGYFYRQSNNGDGFYMQGAYFEGGGIYVSKAYGGHMDSIIGGNHYFNNVQNIEISNSHFEIMDYLSWFNTTVLTFKNSKNVRVINNWFGNRYGNKMIVFDDTAGTTQSGKIYLENNNFMFMCEASGCIRATDIDFYNATTSDEFYFKNNYGYFNNIGLTTYEPFGMKVNSTGVSELRTLLQNQGYLLTGGETNIKYDAQAGWRIAKIGLEDLTIYSQLGQPSISYIGEQTSASYHGGIASATTYYYKVASLDRNFFTNTTSASTFTTTSSNAAIEMTINARNIPSILRIWRGTSAASMDRYVDIPVNEYVISIFDQGDVIGGYLWQTGGVPSITTYSNTSNILDYNGTIRASNATITDLISFKSNFTGSNYFESLKYANCDVKAYSNNGSLYCGTDATGLGGFTYANYFDQDLNKTSHVTFGSVNASLNASWVANPYWATLLSLIANITSLSGAIDSNLTKANSNIQANQTLIVNRESADNTTQAGLISSLDTRESANNQTQNSLIAGKASLTGAAFTGNIAGVNVSANLTVDASSGIYDTSANYFIWNGTCWDQAVGATHVYTCT